MRAVFVGARWLVVSAMVGLLAADCGSSGSGATGSGGAASGISGGAGKTGTGGSSAGSGGGVAGAAGAGGMGGAAGTTIGGSGGGVAGAGGAGNGASQGGAGRGGAGGVAGGGGGTGGRASGAAGGAAAGNAGSGGAAGAAGTNTGWTSIPNNLLNPWPPPDRFPSLLYDSGRGVVVMLLGDDSMSVPLAVWDLDVTTSRWTNRLPMPAPSFSAWPITRAAFGAAYDSTHARTFLFGGFSGNYFADFWKWDGAADTWTNLTPPMPYPANWPGIRSGHGLVYDSDRDKLVMFGGLGGYILLDDLWEYDPATGTWTNRTPTPLPAVWPGPRQAVSMVYDQARKRTVLFGGDNAPPTGATRSPLAELWEWDGTAAVWTNRTPATLPVAGWPAGRADYGMAYDTTRARTLYFGDQTASQEFWEWNGGAGSWIDRTPNPIPASGWPQRREIAGIVVVPGPDLLVLFGGDGNVPNAGFGALDDLWYWQAPGP